MHKIKECRQACLTKVRKYQFNDINKILKNSPNTLNFSWKSAWRVKISEKYLYTFDPAWRPTLNHEPLSSAVKEVHSNPIPRKVFNFTFD